MNIIKKTKKMNKIRKVLSKITIALFMLQVVVANVVMVGASTPGWQVTNVTAPTSAADAAGAVAGIVKFFAGWISIAGIVMAFVGAIQFAMALRNEDADAKSKAMLTIIAGAAIFGVCGALGLFGIAP